MIAGPGIQTIDVCTSCHFLWFDTDEYHGLDDVPESETQAPRTPSLPPQAAEALARFQLDHDRTMASHKETAERGGRLPAPDAVWKTLPAVLGLPVEYDSDVIVRRPWATWALLAVTALVSTLAFTDLDAAVSRFGFIPAEPLRLFGLTTLTSFFLHVGWLHLLSNLYFLWIFGDNAEDLLGLPRYLLLVFAATLGGNVLHAVVTSHPWIPCVGASGGISGVIAYYALRLPHARIGFLWFYFAWFRLPASVAFVLWVGIQLWGVHSEHAAVAYGAHLGGAAVGFLFWLFTRQEERRAVETLRSG